MKIAYSCAGEGFGHAARMAALSPHLEKRHNVFYFISSPLLDFLKKRLPGKSFRRIPCFKFIRDKNKIDILKTTISGIIKFLDFPRKIIVLSRCLKKLSIDVVISDFEPYLPWAALLAGIPVVQMNHPGIVVKHVSLNPVSWAAALSALLMEGPYKKRIHISFYNGDTGPIIRRRLLEQERASENFIVVNIKHGIREQVLDQLHLHCAIPFVVYPNPDGDFDRDMNRCLAVISNAGHQTLSEALVLRKPILAIPEENQYEQMLNAQMLKTSGLGDWCTLENFGSTVKTFVENISHYQEARILPAQFNIEDSTDALHEKLDNVIAQLTGTEIFSIDHENKHHTA